MARYRERRSVSGAKSDGADAHTLADMVRTDAHQLRPVEGDSPDAEAIKVVALAHKTLIWERTRHTQRPRHQLRDYFPAALDAFADLAATDSLLLLAKAPDPPCSAGAHSAGAVDYGGDRNDGPWAQAHRREARLAVPWRQRRLWTWRSSKVFSRLWISRIRRSPSSTRSCTGRRSAVGHEACNRENRLTRKRVDLTDNCQPESARPRTGHPGLVLAGVMLDGTVTPHQADLISGVHLDQVHRSTAARKLGLTRYQIGLDLAAAERRLADYLDAA